MGNLRELAEADLAVSLEDATQGFGLPVILIDPDGVIYDDLIGQILYESTTSTDAGVPIVVPTPVVTVRRSSLTRVPLSTDRPRWACQIPTTPDVDATVETFRVEVPPEGGGSIGFMRLYLTRAEQS